MHIDKYTIIINDHKYDQKKDKRLPHQTKIEVDKCIHYKELGRLVDEMRDAHHLYDDLEITFTFTQDKERY
tara:strand:- start:743 stop:955 length:213 start_codon:yes stop_codon:yes gene_type:complete